MARQAAAPVAVVVLVDVVAVPLVADAEAQVVAAVVDLAARAAVLVAPAVDVDVARVAKVAAPGGEADVMVVDVAAKGAPVRNASRATW